MTAKQHGLKKYIVRLSDEERAQLIGLLDKGKHPAQKLLKARILLKARAVQRSLLNLIESIDLSPPSAAA